jgi:hypothetical protein
MYSDNYWVDPVSGSNSNSGNSIDEPFLTITYALSQMNNSGQTLQLMSGTYPENVTVTNENIDIIGSSNSGCVYLSGSWLFNLSGSSVRIRNCEFNGLVEHSNVGMLYVTQCVFGSGASFIDNSTGYFNALNCDWGSAMSISLQGSHLYNFTGGAQSILDISAGTVIINSSLATDVVNISGGTLVCRESYIISSAPTTSAITATGSAIIQLINCNVITPAGAMARVNYGPSTSYSFQNTTYDFSNSVFSGTNLDLPPAPNGQDNGASDSYSSLPSLKINFSNP